MSREPKPQNNYLGEIMRMMMVFIYMKGCCVADVDGIKFSFLMLNFAESSLNILNISLTFLTISL